MTSVDDLSSSVPSTLPPVVLTEKTICVGAQDYHIPLGPISRFELTWSWQKTARSRYPKLLPTTYLPLSRFQDFLRAEGIFASPRADPNPKQFGCSRVHGQTTAKQDREAKKKKTTRVQKLRPTHDEFPYKRTFHCRCGFRTAHRQRSSTSAPTCPPTQGVIRRPNTKRKNNATAAFCGCKASFKVGVPVSTTRDDADPVIPITYLQMEHQNHCVASCLPFCEIPGHYTKSVNGKRLGFHRQEISDVLREFLRFQYRNNSNVKPKDIKRAWRERRVAEGALVLDPTTGEVSKEVRLATRYHRIPATPQQHATCPPQHATCLPLHATCLAQHATCPPSPACNPAPSTCDLAPSPACNLPSPACNSALPACNQPSPQHASCPPHHATCIPQHATRYP